MSRLRQHSLTPALSTALRTRLHDIISCLLTRGEFLSQQEGDTRVLYALNSPAIQPRMKGPRDWADVPESEILEISALVLAHLKCISGCDDHMKGIATYLGIGRLTKPLKEYLSNLLQSQV